MIKPMKSLYSTDNRFLVAEQEKMAYRKMMTEQFPCMFPHQSKGETLIADIEEIKVDDLRAIFTAKLSPDHFTPIKDPWLETGEGPMFYTIIVNFVELYQVHQFLPSNEFRTQSIVITTELTFSRALYSGTNLLDVEPANFQVQSTVFYKPQRPRDFDFQPPHLLEYGYKPKTCHNSPERGEGQYFRKKIDNQRELRLYSTPADYVPLGKFSEEEPAGYIFVPFQPKKEREPITCKTYKKALNKKYLRKIRSIVVQAHESAQALVRDIVDLIKRSSKTRIQQETLGIGFMGFINGSDIALQNLPGHIKVSLKEENKNILI
jgi:hypothetical protein